MASGDMLLVWSPKSADFPASNYATLNLRNNSSFLSYDKDTDQAVYFTGVMPTQNTAAGVVVQIAWSSPATSGTCRWQGAFERHVSLVTDTDSDSFQANAPVAWAAAHAYSVDDAVTGSGDTYQCSTAGTSGSTEPGWASAATVTDGSVTWKKVTTPGTTITHGDTAPTISGAIQYTTLNFSSSQINGIAANEEFRFRLNRDADGTFGTDDMGDNAEIHSVSMRSL